MSEIEPQMKADIGPEDFGVPAEFSERARRFHNFMAAEQVRQAVLAERERCARVCDAQCEVYGIKMDQTDRERQGERWDRLHAYQEAVENIAAAIHRG